MTILCGPAPGTVKIAGRCRIQKDCPWNIAVIFCPQFFFFFPSNQCRINKEVYCQRLCYIGINFLEKTANISVIWMFWIRDCFTDHPSLCNEFSICKLICPVHHLRHMFVWIFINIIKSLFNPQFL